MRTVFSTHFQVAHVWAQQQQEFGISGSLYFEGNTIYSYGHHFPISTIVKNIEGESAYVFNSNHYSSSTAKHKYAVCRAIPSNATMFTNQGCYFPEIRTEGKRTFYNHYDDAVKFVIERLNGIVSLIQKQQKARSKDYADEICDMVNTMNSWIGFWTIDKESKWFDYDCTKHKYIVKSQPSAFDYVTKKLRKCQTRNIWGLSLLQSVEIQRCMEIMINAGFYGIDISREQAYQLIAEYANEDLENSSAVKKAREAERRYVRRKNDKSIKEDMSKLEEWRNKKIYNWNPCYYFEKCKGWNTALKVSGNEIVTSKGIYLDFEEGKRLWKLIQMFEEKGFKHDLAVDTNGYKWAFNDYKNHVLTAGCHKIPFSECKRIAEIMNW